MMKKTSDLLSTKGSIVILSYLNRNPGATAAMINAYFTQSPSLTLTTAIIYQ